MNTRKRPRTAIYDQETRSDKSIEREMSKGSECDIFDYGDDDFTVEKLKIKETVGAPPLKLKRITKSKLNTTCQSQMDEKGVNTREKAIAQRRTIYLKDLPSTSQGPPNADWGDNSQAQNKSFLGPPQGNIKESRTGGSQFRCGMSGNIKPTRQNRGQSQSMMTSGRNNSKFDSSDDSSGDMRPSLVMNQLKSPKYTGNFTKAYQSGNGNKTTPQKNLLESVKTQNFKTQIPKITKSPKDVSQRNVEQQLSSNKVNKQDIINDWDGSQIESTSKLDTTYQEITLTDSATSSQLTIKAEDDVKPNGESLKMSPTDNLERIGDSGSESENTTEVDDDDEDINRNEGYISSVKISQAKVSREENLSDTLSLSKSDSNETAPQLCTEHENKDEEDMPGDILPGTPVHLTKKARTGTVKDANESRRSTIVEEDDDFLPPSLKVAENSGDSRRKEIGYSKKEDLAQKRSGLRSSKKHVTEERKDPNFRQNMQLINNMDCLNIQMYMEWLGKRYEKQACRAPFINIRPLFTKILMQKEVHFLIMEKMQEIRANIYLMETKSCVELYGMITEVIKNIIEADLEQVTKVYHSTLNIFRTK